MPEPPLGGVSGGVGAVKVPTPKLVTLKREVYDRYKEILARAGYDQLARLGIQNAAEWNADRPGIDALARQRTDELFDATFKTARGRARVALLDELSKNLKPQEQAVNLRKRFRSVGRRQAYTAVATEVRDLVNLATLQAWQGIGMTHVRASDGHGGLTGRTDPTCVTRNGKVYPIDVALTMTTGHDPTVHPRCTLGWLPVVPKGGLATTLAEPTGTGAAGTILIPEGVRLALALPDGAWHAEPRLRWPKGTPGVDHHGHPLAGEYMRGGDVIDALEAHVKRTGDDTLDMSWLASGAHRIRTVHVRGKRGALLFSVNVEDAASGREANVGLAWLDGEDLDPDRLKDALEQIDAGMPIDAVAHAIEERNVAAQVVATEDYRVYAQAVNPQEHHLSDRFQVDRRRREGSRMLRQIAKHVFAAVDQVHTHDAPSFAKVIPILADRTLQDEGQMSTYSENGPVEILLNPESDQPYLTLAHELGHYIDRQVIGRDFFMSDPGLYALGDDGIFRRPDHLTPSRDKLMGDVLDAIEASDAVTLLRGMDHQTEPTVVEQDGRRREVMPNAAYVQYNLFPWELFARAYTQWIALRSGNPDLVHDHEEFLPNGGYATMIREAFGLYYPRQWEWHDFAEIAHAMDNLFADKGFLRDGVRGADPAGLLTPKPFEAIVHSGQDERTAARIRARGVTGTIWTTTSHGDAVDYAGYEPDNVFTYHVHLQNPLHVDAPGLGEIGLRRYIEQAKRDGNDGIVAPQEDGSVHVIVFDPSTLTPADGGGAAPPAPAEMPGAWPERGLAWQRRWDALPDDQPVWLFHATTPEHADTLLREGSDPATKPRSLARQRYEAGEHATFQPGAGLSSGLTVGQTPWDVSGYGRRLLAVQVPKGWVKVSPEQANLGETDPGGALRVNDAVVDRPVPASAFREIDTGGKVPGLEVFDRLGGGGGGAAPPGPELPPSVNPALIGHVNDWSQSRPWERPKADYAAGRVPGFTYKPDGGPGVAARMPAGSDTVHIFDGAFDHTTGKPDSLLMYHEAGHAVANVILQRQNGLQPGNDAWKALEPWYHPTGDRFVNHKWRNPWLNPYGDTPSYSDNPEEILAEAYAQLIHGDLDRRYTYVPGLDGPPGEGFTPDELAAKQKWRDLYEFVAAAAADMGLPSHRLWKLERGPNGETMTVPAKPQGDLAPVPAPGDVNPYADSASGWQRFYSDGETEGMFLRVGDRITLPEEPGREYRVTKLAVLDTDVGWGTPTIQARLFSVREGNGSRIVNDGETVDLHPARTFNRVRAYPSLHVKVGDQIRAQEGDTGRYVRRADNRRDRRVYRLGGWRLVETLLQDGTPFTRYRRILIEQNGDQTDQDMDTVLTYTRKPKWAAQQEREQAERAARNTPTDLNQGAYVNYLTGEHRAALQGMVFNQGAEPITTEEQAHIQAGGSVSRDKVIATRYLRALQQMPVGILEALKNAPGYRPVSIYLGAGQEKITDLDEEQSKENNQPRGWTPGSKMWQTGGYYVPYTGKVLVGNGKSDGSRSVLLHELGHAIGDKLGVDNESALQGHHARLKNGLRPYYSGAAHKDTSTNPDLAGREELWAEAVAVYLEAGGWDRPDYPLTSHTWETTGFLALLNSLNGIGTLDAKFAAYVEDKIRELAGLQPIERPPDALLDPAIRHAISYLDAVPVGGRIRAGRGRDFQDYYVRVEGGWQLTAFYDDGRQLVVAERVIPSSEIADWFTKEPRKLEVS